MRICAGTTPQVNKASYDGISIDNNNVHSESQNGKDANFQQWCIDSTGHGTPIQ